jgi:hypothetical protein
MSMMARFVAVAPAKLEEMRRSPDLVEALFAPQVLPPQFGFTPALEQRVRAQAPQALRSMLDRMPPDLRAQILRSFGIGEGDLDSPNVGDAIAKRMGERAAMLGQLGQAARPTGEPAPKGISLDKAWHGLHYLLCGAAEPAPGPLGQAVIGGTEIGDDLGYGPARYFTAAQAAEIARALQAPGLEANLRARFNPAAMESLGLYPGGWAVNGDAWLIDAFRSLRDFYAAAGAAGQAVVAVIE